MNHCSICTSPMSEPVQELFALPSVASDARPYKAGRSIAICEGCGLVQRVLVANVSFDDVYDDYRLDDHVANPARTKKILDALNLSANVVLDYGSGNGAGVRVLRDKYKMVYGYDPHGTFTNCLKEKPDWKFDLITIFQVLEHVADPIKELKWIHKHLTENGRLLIQVPYCVEWPFDFVIADHVWHFTMQSLSNLLTQVGFLIMKMDNSIIKKEITCVAIKEKNIECNTSNIEHAKIFQAVDWLLDFKSKLDAINEPVAVYGTSVSAMWTGNILGDKVISYVDDDVNRQGIDFNGKRVSTPFMCDFPIIAPFPDWQLEDIKKKHSSLRFI